MVFIKMAWRNLFRNKRRTFIAGIAIGIGLASLIFVDALIIGMKKNMIESATASFTGEGQIHRQGYRQSQDVDLTINHLDSMRTLVRSSEEIKAYSQRILAFGMITSPSNVSSVQFVGIDPQKERHLSQIDDALTAGAYFPGSNERDVIIGSELADILKVKLGDRVVITVAQAHTDELSQEMFRVSGIYHFNIPELDKSVAVVRIGKAQSMLNLPNQAHEIALLFYNNSVGANREHAVFQRLSQFGNKAVSWTELMPQLKAALELTDFSTLITALILFGVVALGIINTLLMSIHERMFEFGVLRAVGTRPFAVGKLVFFEAGALAVLSIFLGALLGLGITTWVAHVGIDYTGIEFAGVTFRRLLIPVLTVDQFLTYPFWVFVFTLLMGLYPAFYAARMSPAHALQKSL